MRIIVLFIIIATANVISAQHSLVDLLDRYNNNSIPYISVSDLEKIKDTVLIFDAREKSEYLVSHLKNAIHVGYNYFSMESVIQQNIPKDRCIIVYCSLGIRSEDISEQLKKAGYLNVYNLFGGIFEWKNKDYPIVNSKDRLTDKVHTYSREWSKWLHKGIKVYSN